MNQQIEQINVFEDNFAKLMMVYRYDPILFIEQILNIKLDEQQRYLVESLYKYYKVTCKSGKGPGKTYAAAALIWHFLMTRHKSQVFITAPGASQIKASLWSDVTEIYNLMAPEFKKDWELLNTQIVNKTMPTAWFCLVRTARRENPQALYGAHNVNMLYVVDEASGVPDENFDSIEATLTQKDNYLLILGNPDHISGFFYDSFKPQMSTIYKQIHMSVFKSTFVDPKSIESKKIKYGEDSNQYRVQVLGDFPISETDSIIRMELVEKAIDNHINKPEGYIYWGVDFGAGTDKSILIKRQGNKVFKDIHVWNFKDLMETVGKVNKEYIETPDDKKPDKIFVDADGLGLGAYNRMKELKLPVIPCKSSNKAIRNKEFYNSKTEAWVAMSRWFREEEPDLPKDLELAEQLYTMKGKTHSSGRYKTEEKHEYRRRNGGKSPDKADALSFTFWKKNISKVNIHFI